jgi:hypothetical protein
MHIHVVYSLPPVLLLSLFLCAHPYFCYSHFIDLFTREQEMSHEYCRMFLRHFEDVLLKSFLFFTPTVYFLKM